MSLTLEAEVRPVAGRVDAEGRLVEADPPLAALHRGAGGVEGGVLALPQIAALARLSRRLGIVISRAAITADGDRDLDLWVRAEPSGKDVLLSLTGWVERPARPATVAAADEPERETDFLRAAADWTWETDESLRITSVSAGASAAFGLPLSELVGKQLTRLFRFRESADGALPILTALAEHSRFDAQVAEAKEGDRRAYELNGVPLIDGMGRFAGFGGSAVSLVAPPAAAQAGEAVSAAAPRDPAAFGERLDQALRAPLNHIIAHAETLRAQKEGPLRGDYMTYASDIASAGRHLLDLVDDLAGVQAIERDDFRLASEPVDLAQISRRAAGLLARRAEARKVRIDQPGPNDSLPAVGDPMRALQVVTNLLSNAIRYSPEDGQVWIRLARQGRMAALTIADQGKGIAPEDHARIFGKFERVDPSEPGGTGLGLYIARRLARAMGGDIAVDSAPGQGARFTLLLPTG